MTPLMIVTAFIADYDTGPGYQHLIHVLRISVQPLPPPLNSSPGFRHGQEETISDEIFQ